MAVLGNENRMLIIVSTKNPCSTLLDIRFRLLRSALSQLSERSILTVNVVFFLSLSQRISRSLLFSSFQIYSEKTAFPVLKSDDFKTGNAYKYFAGLGREANPIAKLT